MFCNFYWDTRCNTLVLLYNHINVHGNVRLKFMPPLELKWYDVFLYAFRSSSSWKLETNSKHWRIMIRSFTLFSPSSFRFLASWAWTKGVIGSQNIFWFKFDAFASVITHLIILILITYRKAAFAQGHSQKHSPLERPKVACITFFSSMGWFGFKDHLCCSRFNLWILVWRLHLQVSSFFQYY